MGQLVATGQITLYDHNDAAPITAFIAASQGLSQTKAVSDSEAIAYSPDYSSVNNVLTAAIYVGSTNVVASLANRKWSLNDPAGASIGSGSSFIVNTNQDPDAASQRTYYFQGDYTDPITRITTHIMASIVLVAVKTGTNAVFILIRGQTVITKSGTATLACAKVWADLIRGATVDTSGLNYKWIKGPNYAVADQLDANHGDITPTQKVKFVATANINGGNWSSYAAIPADGTWADVKGIEVREDAVVDIGLYKVQITDGTTIWEAYFQIYDVGDPYDIQVLSDSGLAYQNGQGTKVLTPKVFQGANALTLDASWSFRWYLADRDGAKSGFIDTAKTASPGLAISANTAGITGNVTHAALGAALAAGAVIKLISSDGLTIRCYEVGTGSTTTNTIFRSPLNGFSAVAPTLNQFAGGKLYVLVNSGADGGVQLSTGAATITSRDIDVDGSAGLTIEAYH